MPDDEETDGRTVNLENDDPAASRRGLELLKPPSTPPHHDVRMVALGILLTFGVCIVSVLILVSVTAWFRPNELKEIVGFFGTVVATLGTLLGGVVAFYFARR